MAGMEVLGRNANIIPVAKAAPFKMRSASSAMIVCTIPSVGSGDTFTINEQTSFGGGTTAIPVIKNIYWTAALNGTAAWNKITYSQTNLTGIFLTAGGPLSAITLGTAGTTGLLPRSCSDWLEWSRPGYPVRSGRAACTSQP